MKLLLFAGSTYYPQGGWDDYVGEFDSLVEGREWLISQDKSHPQPAKWWEWAQFVADGVVLERWRYGYDYAADYIPNWGYRPGAEEQWRLGAEE